MLIRLDHLRLFIVAAICWTAPWPPALAQDTDPEHNGISVKEASFLIEHRRVRLGVATDYPPYDYIGQDGSHQGIGAAYAALLSKRLGIQFEIVPATSMLSALDDLRHGRVDMLASIGRSPEREALMRLSQPYLTGPWAIVTRADASGIIKLSDLNDHSVSVVRSQPIRDTLKRSHPRVRLVLADDVHEAMDRVDRGEAFATVDPILVAGELIQKAYLGRLKIASTIPDVAHEVGFGVRNDWPELADAIDKTLAAIPEEEHRRIRALGLAREVPATLDWNRALLFAGPIVAAFVITLVSVLLTNRRMRREIDQRRELEKALTDNEERLRTILRAAPEAVITVDHAGHVTYWNPAAERIFGYSESEALGLDVHRLIAASADREMAQNGMGIFATSGRGTVLGQIMELDAVHKSGRVIPVDIARAAFRQNREWHAVAFVRDTTERRRAESEVLEAKAAAEASRRRLLDMSDALPCAVYQIRIEQNGNRRYKFVSKNVAAVLGVDLDTLRADEQARWRHVHEDDVGALRAMIDRVALREEKLFCEYRVRLGGGVKWIRQEALRQKQSDGSVVWNGYWLDVTEIKRAEATLSDQLIFQRLLLDSLPNAVFFKGADGRFLGCNRACENMFGVPRTELVGRNATELDLFSPESRIALHAADLALIGEQGSRHLQTGMRFADGLEHEVLYWATGFALSDGRPGGMIGVVVDISEQKRAEALVKETEQWYRSILETAPDGMLVADGEGRITLVNAQIERLFGYKRDELLGQPVEKLVPARLREVHRQHRSSYLAAAATRPMGAGMELFAVAKDGSGFPVEVGLAPLPGRIGEALSVSASIRDISERKRDADALREAKEHAEEATRAKSMFLANMSHEIRTPLNAVIGMAHLALGTALTARQRDYMAKIHDASISLLSIINDILDFSKIEAGRMDVERVAFSLEDTLAHVSLVVEQRAAEKGLEVLIHPPVSAPAVVSGDPLRLGQILTNLMNNAVKFTERGEIELTTRVEERADHQVRLHFTVRDTGVGMSEEQVRRLFQPFTQADGSTTRRYGGTGLGLTICKRLVELMDGRIWAESRVGVGSSFHFTLKLGVAAERVAAARALPAALTGLRVLVVNDHPMAREIVVEGLSGLPLRIDTAASAQEALERLRGADGTDPYRVVFMDWKMPVVDGAEATRMIKSDTGLLHCPHIIIVAAFARDETRARADASGADGFLVKPLSRAMLVDALLDALEPTRRLPPIDTQTPTARQLAGMRVLLVEDNEINQQIAAELLRNAGAEVDVAANGQLALDQLTATAGSSPYDGVLMDLQMPVMDGLEATRAIKRDARLAELPVIAMTAHALADEREQCLAAGMSDHLAKPIDPKQMIATLRRWWRRSTEETQFETLLALSDLDAADGLRRVSGELDLYLSLLRHFARDERDAPERMAAALADGDYKLAERDAHTVKGVAANLGAQRVRQAAQALESAIRDSAPQAKLLLAQQAYGHATRSLVGDIDRLLPISEATTTTASSSHINAAAVLKRLADLLAQYDGEAVEFFESMRPTIHGALAPEIFERIEQALRSYRFDEGLDALKSSLAPLAS